MAGASPVIIVTWWSACSCIPPSSQAAPSGGRSFADMTERALRIQRLRRRVAVARDRHVRRRLRDGRRHRLDGDRHHVRHVDHGHGHVERDDEHHRRGDPVGRHHEPVLTCTSSGSRAGPRGSPRSCSRACPSASGWRWRCALTKRPPQGPARTARGAGHRDHRRPRASTPSRCSATPTSTSASPTCSCPFAASYEPVAMAIGIVVRLRARGAEPELLRARPDRPRPLAHGASPDRRRLGRAAASTGS